jgi:glycosyltransferase involved in cell wall biosynthesis
MRRILVVTSGALFVRGGHLVIAEEIVAALRRQGYEAELLVTPQNRFGRQLSAYWASWLTDVSMTADGRSIDGVISLRFPSYAVRHPFHICWINHRMREYYDLWEDLIRGLGRKGRIKERIRRLVFHKIDRFLLTRNVARVVSQSRTIQRRLERFGGVPSEVLYPPAPERDYRTDYYGESIFAVSRLDRLKRIDLLVESAAHVKNKALRFRIAGEGPEAPRIRARIKELKLEGRVELLGSVSESGLITELSRCRAVFFAPRSEDYGLVTLQAFRSAKAVITANDSGGPTELVRDGENGFVVAPDPAAAARRIEQLGDDRALAERLGQTALNDSRDHTWERAIGELLRIGPLTAS